MDFKITNPATYNQYITTVAVAITSVTGGSDLSKPACTASDFTLTQPTAINLDLTPGDHAYSPSGSTLALDNETTNQDNCKGATVALSFTAS